MCVPGGARSGGSQSGCGMVGWRPAGKGGGTTFAEVFVCPCVCLREGVREGWQEGWHRGPAGAERMGMRTRGGTQAV